MPVLILCRRPKGANAAIALGRHGTERALSYLRATCIRTSDDGRSGVIARSGCSRHSQHGSWSCAYRKECSVYSEIPTGKPLRETTSHVIIIVNVVVVPFRSNLRRFPRY